MTYIFLDSNVILIYSVKIDYPDGKVIEHPHYQRLEPFFRVLIQAIQKGGARVIESLTVFDECENKIDKVVEDSIEKTRNATEGYLDFISLIRNKARKRLKDFLEMVDKPPIDVEQRDKIKKEKVIPLHTTLISENKIPMDKRWSDNDIKILADATYLLQKNKYAPFYFCTTETCLVVGKRTKASRETTTIHIQDLIYPTLGFNTYFPTDIISLI